jgi:hypothetical protein
MSDGRLSPSGQDSSSRRRRWPLQPPPRIARVTSCAGPGRARGLSCSPRTTRTPTCSARSGNAAPGSPTPSWPTWWPGWRRTSRTTSRRWSTPGSRPTSGSSPVSCSRCGLQPTGGRRRAAPERGRPGDLCLLLKIRIPGTNLGPHGLHGGKRRARTAPHREAIVRAPRRARIDGWCRGWTNGPSHVHERLIETAPAVDRQLPGNNRSGLVAVLT